jgi:hypothetical protein
MIVQQPGAVQSLAGVVDTRRPDTARAHFTPRVELLPADDRAAAVGRQADAAEVVAVQVGHGVTRAVAHRYDLAAHAVVALGCLLPGALDGHGVPVVSRDRSAASFLQRFCFYGCRSPARRAWSLSALLPSALQQYGCRPPARRAAGATAPPAPPAGA